MQARSYKWMYSLVLATLALVGGPAGAANPADVKAVVGGDTQFALDLYAQLRSREGNLFFSPYSISTALAMTYAGARGETAEEMARVLHFPIPGERLHPAFRAIIQGLNGHGLPREYQLHTVNALWGQRDAHFLDSFRKVTRKNYGAALRRVDFVRAVEQARRDINRWVEAQTSGRIKELIGPRVLDHNTRLVLTNAIYFKAAWDSPFKAGNTRKADFQVVEGKKVPVDLMRQTASFRYHEEDGLQALEMPYEGGDLSMVVLLPRRVGELETLEKSLTPARLDKILSRMKKSRVETFLPRFKVRAELKLKDVLISLGMKRAFSDAADFSGMTGSPDLRISQVIHQAFVDVNEEGTEAAAATAVVMKLKAIPPPPVVFRADRPFVFLIRDTRAGNVLFLGRLADPSVR